MALSLKLLIAVSGSALALPGLAIAASGKGTAQATGTAQAVIIAASSVTAVDALRFGDITQPAALGLLQITPAGAVAGAGGMTPAVYNIPQTGAGRGPGSFMVHGNPNQLFTTTLPLTATITGASGQSMTVLAFSDTTGGATTALSASGTYKDYVGGYLLINGGQAPGNYSGTYTITVTYQ